MLVIKSSWRLEEILVELDAGASSEPATIPPAGSQEDEEVEERQHQSQTILKVSFRDDDVLDSDQLEQLLGHLPGLRKLKVCAETLTGDPQVIATKLCELEHLSSIDWEVWTYPDITPDILHSFWAKVAQSRITSLSTLPGVNAAVSGICLSSDTTRLRDLTFHCAFPNIQAPDFVDAIEVAKSLPQLSSLSFVGCYSLTDDSDVICALGDLIKSEQSLYSLTANIHPGASIAPILQGLEHNSNTTLEHLTLTDHAHIVSEKADQQDEEQEGSIRPQAVVTEGALEEIDGCASRVDTSEGELSSLIDLLETNNMKLQRIQAKSLQWRAEHYDRRQELCKRLEFWCMLNQLETPKGASTRKTMASGDATIFDLIDALTSRRQTSNTFYHKKSTAVPIAYYFLRMDPAIWLSPGPSPGIIHWSRNHGLNSS
ncbi:expressed unknown protein [Seminavis robusta]|uniref:RNI-like protein n=1 Tax=Seminavis robusta TaxID=568900 RepID=A0A9N8HVZ9_9STRA|nr:expressed unknown protein [Seminavis robusta]|eukprot:Sro1896_g304030.1 n/a (429) ;mRNA; f:6780-8066